MVYYIKKNFPADYDATKWILSYPQYFGFKLTGNAGAEPTWTGQQNLTGGRDSGHPARVPCVPPGDNRRSVQGRETERFVHTAPALCRLRPGSRGVAETPLQDMVSRPTAGLG